MISKNSNVSLEENLSIEKLSSLLNDLSIITHPFSNEQKVCIEFPNINLEHKDINILSDETNNNKKNLNEEFTLNISKNKKYYINPENLFNEFNKSIPYSIEEFKNSLKIFVSIFNCFNDDLFKWNLSDFNLFNNQNIIQIMKFNKGNKKIFVNSDFIDELYKKHFSIKYDSQKTEIIEITMDNSKEQNNIDDFEKDFFDKDSINEEKNVKNNDLFCYEKDTIFRNIYFLMSIFNLMNKFVIKEYNLDNILKNISKFNSYIINDYKIILLILFHLSIQINLYIKKAKVDNFLDIKPTLSDIKINSKENIINNFYPNIFFLDYQEKKLTKDENELKKEKIILFNIILKLFNLSYLTKIESVLKINIKIFSISYFSNCKSKLIFEQNYFYNSNNFNYLLDFMPNKIFVELFNNDTKQFFSTVIFEFILSPDIDINIINNLTLIYYPFIINSDFVSFDTLENDTLIKYSLDNYLNEIVILSWALKLILKTIKTTKKIKFAFTFVFNSFSIALKKDINNKNNINIQDLMIYMGIYHYNEIDMIKYINEGNNYYALYKEYKEILKSCGEYNNYNINIRLFKNGIINKELQYHFISLILNILNNIKIKNKTFYKNISLYESKFINTIKCIFIRIKKQNKIVNKINISNNNNMNNEFEHKESAIFSPKKLRNSSKNQNIFGKLSIFRSKNDFINNIKSSQFNENFDKNDIYQKKSTKKFNNFYKNLSNCTFLSKLESDTLINFFKSVNNYFTDFMFYIERINLKNNNKNKNKFIFENTFDSSLSFDPINILRNFNNNKCFIILKEFSYIDLYIYLYDFYENNINDENSEQKSKNEIYNDIFNNINILRENCYNNFIDQKNTNCSIVIGKLNFIVHKYFLIMNQYFDGNKIFFRNENKIIILDKFTNTDCVLDNGHIDIILNNINEKNEAKAKDENKEENNFIKFYTTFLYEYDIIKYIVQKRLIKINKLNIIIKRKILQINNGKIQLKKINLNKNIKQDEEKILIDSNNSTPTKNENIKNIIINEKSNNKTKKIFNENYNLFKIRDLFKYKNSYPLIIFFLQNETEISNFPFLLYTFAEIFLNKSNQELTKELLTKRIVKFFYGFKNAKFIPIIFCKKYFQYFLELFNELITKIQKKSPKENQESSSSSKKNLINLNKFIFSNIILFPINKENSFNQNELIDYSNKDKLNNLTKTISICQIENFDIDNYDMNQIGKIFKLNRINDTLPDIEKKSIKNKLVGNNNVIIYNINSKDFNFLIKKNIKKVKFIGIDEEDRTFNIHIFDSEDSLKKYSLENKNNDENCTIF